MCTERIRVLYVGDKQEFRDLTDTRFGHEDSPFAVETAPSAEEGLRMATGHPPDCIVSDYNIPDMGGVAFLQTVRQAHPKVPFILYPDEESESVVSDALAAGVSDYLEAGVDSDQFELLAHRIESAVRARRDARRVARQNELTNLTEYAGETGGWELDLASNTLHLTDGARRLIGVSGDRVLSLEEAVEMYHPEDRQSIRQALDRAAETGERTDGTWRLQTQDGDERVLEVTTTPVAANGDITAVRGAINDITQQREREREVEQTETLFESTQDTLFLIDATDEFTFEQVNAAWENMSGLPAEEAHGQTVEEVFYEESASMGVKLRECVDSREPLRYERTVERNGERRSFMTRIAPVVIDDTVEYVAGSAQDVTDQREQQRELEAERQFAEQAINSLEQLLYVADAEEGLQRWNNRVPEVTGYTQSELTGMDPLEFLAEDDREDAVAAIEAIQSGEDVTLEADLRTADGRRIPYEFTGRTMTDSEGNATGFVGIARDISERQRRERRFQALVEESSDVISVVDADGRFEYQSPSLERILGYDPGETLGDTVWEYIHPADSETVREVFGEWTDNPDQTETLEYRARHADGSWRWMEVRLTDQSDNPAVDGYVINSRDITDRKHREKEAAEIKNQYQTLVDNYPGGAVCLFDADIRVVRAGGTELSEIGLSSDSLEGTTPHEQYPQNVAERLTSHVEKALAGESHTFQQAYDGQHYRSRVAPVRTGDGEITHCMLVSENVTERKQRQEQLQRTNRAIEAVPVGITITDASQPDNPIIDVNEKFVSMTGYSRDDVLGQTHRFLGGEQTSDAAVEQLQARIEDEKPVSAEFRSYRKDGAAFWSRVEVAPVRDETGDVVNYVWFVQDVTGQKEDKQRLEKRKQTLRKLHEATREFYPPSDGAEISEFLVGFLSSAFEFSYVSVKQFDGAKNRLQPAAQSSVLSWDADTFGPVEPGQNPIWRAYEQGEPRAFDMNHVASPEGFEQSIDQGLAVPIGDFGVVVLYAPDDDPIDDVARDLLDVVTANAESAFQRFRAAKTYADVAAELSTQQAKVEELTTITEALQRLHEDLAAKETRDSLDRRVCDRLAQTSGVDFALIGRPEGVETNLQPTTWAGQESGYLNEIDLGNGDESLPAQRVVAEHEQCLITDIGSHATDADWAKYALTAGFRSVISVPLVYDGVLYGVLSAYSTEEGVFGQTYGDLVTNAGSLLVSYNRTLANRYEGTRQEFTMLEFELSDPAYPFHRLAASTDCRIRVDTVVETTDTEMRLLVTVLDGDPETVFEQASSVAAITDIDWFGDDSEQLRVSVQKPFLASVLGKHGAVLFDAVSDSEVTSFRVKLPKDTPKRPVLDSLMSEYEEITPVAQRQRTNPNSIGTLEVDEILTERQQDVLRVAFHGGYYETPKQVTGDDIAANFDISNTAVYNHLRASHRRILESALGSESEYQQ